MTPDFVEDAIDIAGEEVSFITTFIQDAIDFTGEKLDTAVSTFRELGSGISSIAAKIPGHIDRRLMEIRSAVDTPALDNLY